MQSALDILAMKIAMPVWNGRVSPVMDTATSLFITAREAGKEDLNYTMPLPHSGIYHRAMFMAGLKIDTLICGAISRPFEELLTRNGIRIYPWVSGEINEVLAAFWNGNLANREFRLPGCRFRNRGSRGFGAGRRNRKKFN
jgi:predicted Fe-Mo cluster-binding NifX family protein